MHSACSGCSSSGLASAFLALTRAGSYLSPHSTTHWASIKNAASESRSQSLLILIFGSNRTHQPRLFLQWLFRCCGRFGRWVSLPSLSRSCRLRVSVTGTGSASCWKWKSSYREWRRWACCTASPWNTCGKKAVLGLLPCLLRLRSSKFQNPALLTTEAC